MVAQGPGRAAAAGARPLNRERGLGAACRRVQLRISDGCGQRAAHSGGLPLALCATANARAWLGGALPRVSGDLRRLLCFLRVNIYDE